MERLHNTCLHHDQSDTLPVVSQYADVLDRYSVEERHSWSAAKAQGLTSLDGVTTANIRRFSLQPISYFALLLVQTGDKLSSV